MNGCNQITILRVTILEADDRRFFVSKWETEFKQNESKTDYFRQYVSWCCWLIPSGLSYCTYKKHKYKWLYGCLGLPVVPYESRCNMSCRVDIVIVYGDYMCYLESVVCLGYALETTAAVTISYLYNLLFYNKLLPFF